MVSLNPSLQWKVIVLAHSLFFASRDAPIDARVTVVIGRVVNVC
jgi:hypothetical protein